MKSQIKTTQKSFSDKEISIEELMNLRGKFIEPNQIPFDDFKKLLQMCDYSESESEMAIDIWNNGEGQYVI
jgi:hypothetical protein